MIPLLDLKAQYLSVQPELDPAVLEVLASGHYVLGPQVGRFEREFAAFCGSPEAITVNTGTSALHLALLALGVGPGDEVVTVSMTFVATVAAVLYTGATPVLVDVDPDRWTLDPAALEAAITPRTKAIVPVHLHGRLADMNAIIAIARKHGVPVVEDAAQAHGAESHGRRAGTFGDVGCFSFYPGKNLGACGEGGAITFARPELGETMRSLRDWGTEGKYNHVRHGFNYRMDALQAAILSVKLKRLEAWTAARRAVARRYDELISDRTVEKPAPSGLDHVHHVYAVRTADREALKTALEAAGVSTGVHYPTPVHLQPAYQHLGYARGSLPVSERLASEFLSLPIYPEMTDDQIGHIANTINRISVNADARAA